ncbi:hypothetical protein N9N28_11445 [Rubripirellula amarantea]|nr:hypothetical protein [Rubripirellula amarantea]
MRFPESMKAGRFLYSTEQEYAGRLFNVTKRSIENQADDIVLLRLEFEIFVMDVESTPAAYLPTGGIASRDIVITKQAGSDERVAQYAQYLGIKRPSQVANWYVAERKASQGKEPWIRIRFGTPDEDHRQPFEHISELDKPKPEQIKPSGSTKEREKFWRVSEVRQLLRDETNKIPSEDTVKRFVDKRKSEFGEELVRVTTGRQRRINWYLCWHLWEADKCYG